MSALNCPQCGAASAGAECPRCRYSPAVCRAEATTGHRGMDPFRWVKVGAILPVVLLVVAVSGLANRPSDPSKQADVKPDNQQAQPTPPAPGNGTLDLTFDSKQNFEGLEVFIDGTVRPSINVYNRRLTLQLSAGRHTLALQIRSREVLAREVVVKPPTQGATRVTLPEVGDPTLPGTLEITIKSLDGNWPWANGLELFVNEKLAFTSQHPFQWNPHSLTRAPGEYTIVLKKNGIEVKTEKVAVKKPSDGKTFLPINLTVTGTIVVKNPIPFRPAPGITGYVDVDGGNAKQWAVGAITSPELQAEVGRRVITVYMLTNAGVRSVFQRFDVDVKAGGRNVLELKR